MSTEQLATTVQPNLWARLKSLAWQLVPIVLLASFGLGGLAAWGSVKFGSVSSSLAYLRGERLIPDAYSKSVGALQAGQSRDVAFEVRNYSDKPITLLGAKTSCTCMLVDRNLPVVLQAGSRKTLVTTVRPKARNGASKFAEKLIVFSDSPEASQIILRVTGTASGS